ncbi:MAG: hypothetical protein H0U00_08110, partial [Actinobacteria bacterium]|nr:hypothetical protein [Actinomycetota bacterium]
MDALLRWACRAQNAATPVVLVGPSGVGKTHLVRSALAVRQGLSMGQKPRLVSAANLMA